MLEGEDFSAAQAKARSIAKAEDRIIIPAFDDEAVVAGQGTIGLELAAQCRDAGVVLVPVGGGGLIAGVATALKALAPGTRIVGVQAEAAPAAARSLAAQETLSIPPKPTIADGVAIGRPGDLTMALMRRYVEEIVTVGEEAISRAIVLLLERPKLVTEGAGALGVAAILSGAVKAAGKPAAMVLSGGNIDINVLAAIVRHGLLHAGRHLTLTVGLDDRPGTLASLLKLIADRGANVLDVDHMRQGMHLPVHGVAVRLLLETRDFAHIEEIAASLRGAGYVETATEATSRSYRPASWQA